MTVIEWKDKLALNEGEKLLHTGASMKGFMQETDVDTYDVLSADGTKVGTVTVEDHTAVRGLRRTISVCQRDVSGKVLVEESWKVRS